MINSSSDSSYDPALDDRNESTADDNSASDASESSLIVEVEGPDFGNEKQNKRVTIVGIILFSIIVAVIIFHLSKCESKFIAKSIDQFGNINVNALRLSFSKESTHTWQTIESTVRLLRKDGQKVATILLAGVQAPANDRLARAISQELTKTTHIDNFVDLRLINKSSKLSVDEMVNNAVRKNRVVVLLGLDHLKDPLLLYRYCDPYTPLRENKLFIMTLDLPFIHRKLH
ncbi:hypothetical protein ACOME3_004305 [Neoechinorhynchus agilis]